MNKIEGEYTDGGWIMSDGSIVYGIEEKIDILAEMVGEIQDLIEKLLEGGDK